MSKNTSAIGLSTHARRPAATAEVATIANGKALPRIKTPSGGLLFSRAADANRDSGKIRDFVDNVFRRPQGNVFLHPTHAPISGQQGEMLRSQVRMHNTGAWFHPSLLGPRQQPDPVMGDLPPLQGNELREFQWEVARTNLGATFYGNNPNEVFTAF